MGSKVLLIDESCDIDALLMTRSGYYHTCICLFWTAPRTKRRISAYVGGKCLSWEDILGSMERQEIMAYTMVKKVCEAGPAYEEFPWRSDLAGQLYQEYKRLLSLASALGALSDIRHELCCGRLEVDCVLAERNLHWLTMLEKCRENHETIIFNSRNCYDSTPVFFLSRPPLLRRLIRQCHNALITGNWLAQLWYVVEKMDSSYEKRCKWNLPRRRSVESFQGGATFFSSYLNNSRVLQGYERAMPFRSRWLVNNYYAYKGASPDNKTVIEWLWQYSPRKLSRAVDAKPLSRGNAESWTEKVFMHWLRHSTVWDSWKKAGISSTSNMTECWEQYLKKIRPQVIVVANQWGIEGWFTQIAKRRGIPVVQILHGVVGGYFYTKTPIISDALIVPGEFWKNLWPEDQQKKIIVFNPRGYIENISRQINSSRRRLTFFSWPLTHTPFYNFSEFMNGFIHIFQKILSLKDYDIQIRTHPLENPSDFVRRWRNLYGNLDPKITVESGKKGCLEDVLRKTDVALMFRSTVMLNCFANGIPVIMPGWVDFGWDKASMKDIPGLHLATDFDDLEDTLVRWLSSPPKMVPNIIRYFVRPSGEGEEEFRTIMNQLVAAPKSMPQ